MKQEVKDIALQVVYQAPTSIVAWWQQLSFTTAIAIALGLLQICYLARKWWREETDWGVRLKRRAEGKPTEPAPLE